MYKNGCSTFEDDLKSTWLEFIKLLPMSVWTEEVLKAYEALNSKALNEIHLMNTQTENTANG